MVQWLYEKGVALADGVLLTAGGVLLATGQLPIHCSALSGQLAVIEWMYERGVLLDIANHDGEQPIHKAAEGGHLAVVQWLYERGVLLTVATIEELQPIHLGGCTNTVCHSARRLAKIRSPFTKQQ